MTKRKTFVGALLVIAAVIAAAILSAGIRKIKKPIARGAHADYVLVEKSAHTLTLFGHGNRLKTYRVALGRGGSGDKQQADDNKVPEGLYKIASRNARSSFHRSLRISYPSPSQLIQAQMRGVPAGGDIMIHGIRNGLGWLGPMQRYVDWTKGCIAVDDEEIEEIWRVVPDGTPVEIRP